MRFTPISEQEAEAQSANLWPDGTYDFEVREAAEKESSAGNDMIELEMWVYDQSGGRRLVFDYLVASEKSAWKLRHFASASGLLPQYEKGTLMANEMVGRTGRCEITTRKQAGYADKNVVKGYVKATGASAPPKRESTSARAKSPAGDIDDEIPF